MADEPLNYAQMVEDAMRGLVRRALGEVAERGLPGNHHFYVSFLTGAPEVEIPSRLRVQYPEEMTIVLQHQFWNLLVDEEGFSVALSFGGKRENLYIPFAAMTRFADPAAEFGLQFNNQDGDADSAAVEGLLPGPDAEPEGGAEEASEQGARSKGEKIISLDSFRKK